MVVGDGADLDRIHDSAPAATLLVLDGPARCQEVYERTLFPRQRILGVTEEQAAEAIDSIIFERDDEHEVIAMADGEFAPRRVRLGYRGITEVL